MPIERGLAAPALYRMAFSFKKFPRRDDIPLAKRSRLDRSRRQLLLGDSLEANLEKETMRLLQGWLK